MSRNFEEQVVLITGAGAGIGQAAALAFAREGARMVLNSRSVASTHKTADLLRAAGAEVVEVCGDVALPGTAQAMAEAALQHFGWIDVLVNNAGIVIPGTVDTITPDELDRSMATNVRSVLQLTQAVLPAMRARKGGSIVNIASIAGLKGTKNRIAYSASKGALISMSRSMALELAPEHIRVNCVCPGMTHSPSLAARIAASPDPAAAEAGFIAAVPMGALGEPEEIASAILFCADRACSFMTGAVITVDGGKSL